MISAVSGTTLRSGPLRIGSEAGAHISIICHVMLLSAVRQGGEGDDTPPQDMCTFQSIGKYKLALPWWGMSSDLYGMLD